MNLNRSYVLKTLHYCYDIALQGLPRSKSCYGLAEEYVQKYGNLDGAIDKFIKVQLLKCTTTGFLTNIGGLITLPVAIPANIAVSWYVQLQMIATIAVMCGYDPKDDEVRTLAYVCLTGSSVAELCKKAGVQLGEKIALGVIKKIPEAILTKINKLVAFRFVTKFGEKGIVNLGKMVPIFGGFIGGSFDFATTKVIADKAKKVFLYNELD